MRISLVILFCLFVAVVNAATVKPTRRATTKAPARKSAYAYLRSVRGKTSCAGGTCPFWERHGRSFVSLRCYAEQYKECTCLHRMCFRSCLFTRDDCNAEMVSCLKQICPRCMPASATAMCSAYDSLAVQVTNSLSVFACYPCCANLANSPNSGNNTNSPALPTVTTTLSQNGVGAAINNAGLGGTVNAPVGALPTNNGVSNNGGNAGSNQVNNVNQGGANGGSNVVNAVAPGNGLANNNGANTNNGPVRKQREQTTARRTTKRVVTTRRAASTPRTPAQAQKKPQANKPIKN